MEKKKLQFETFPHGVCNLWQLDSRKKPVLLRGNVRYRERTVGERRNYDAEQNGHTIQRLIRIPYFEFAKTGTFVTIGKQQYKVLQAQKIFDTIPICTDLTLENPDILVAFDESEAGAGGRL